MCMDVIACNYMSQLIAQCSGIIVHACRVHLRCKMGSDLRFRTPGVNYTDRLITTRQHARCSLPGVGGTRAETDEACQIVRATVLARV